VNCGGTGGEVRDGVGSGGGGVRFGLVSPDFFFNLTKYTIPIPAAITITEKITIRLFPIINCSVNSIDDSTALSIGVVIFDNSSSLGICNCGKFGIVIYVCNACG
jgi:hypothetical protein